MHPATPGRGGRGQRGGARRPGRRARPGVRRGAPARRDPPFLFACAAALTCRAHGPDPAISSHPFRAPPPPWASTSTPGPSTRPPNSRVSFFFCVRGGRDGKKARPRGARLGDGATRAAPLSNRGLAGRVPAPAPPDQGGHRGPAWPLVGEAYRRRPVDQRARPDLPKNLDLPPLWQPPPLMPSSPPPHAPTPHSPAQAPPTCSSTWPSRRPPTAPTFA